MAGVVTIAKEVPAQPFVVVTTDSSLKTFLNGLNAAGAGGNLSDLANIPEETALWAVPVANGAESGSAYVVSAETYKRIQARRY